MDFIWVEGLLKSTASGARVKRGTIQAETTGKQLNNKLILIMPLIGKNTIEVNKELSETRLPTLLKPEPRFSCNEKEKE